MSVNAWASFFYSLSISPLVCLWSWEFFSIIHLWDVFDVNTDVDNCRTVRWQLKLYVILRHADALCLEMNIFLRLDQIDNTNLSVWIWVKIFFGWRKQICWVIVALCICLCVYIFLLYICLCMCHRIFQSDIMCQFFYKYTLFTLYHKSALKIPFLTIFSCRFIC